MRAAADMLAAIEPLLPAGIAYITEQKTNLFRELSKARPSLVGSEFLADVPRGASHPDGTRCEDLTALSFASGSVGVLLSLDVLEHVADPSLALREIERVLVPGGYAVLTFPFFPSLTETRRRAVLSDGIVKHLLPPVNHGNPISSGGALVFNDFGWDFVEEASGLFADRMFFFYQSFTGWHFGASRFAMILKS
jgi:SAM-dependent methyltransferase